MTQTVNQVWIDAAKRIGAKYIVIASNDGKDFPVYAQTEEEMRTRHSFYSSMTDEPPVVIDPKTGEPVNIEDLGISKTEPISKEKHFPASEIPDIISAAFRAAGFSMPKAEILKWFTQAYKL